MNISICGNSCCSIWSWYCCCKSRRCHICISTTNCSYNNIICSNSCIINIIFNCNHTHSIKVYDRRNMRIWSWHGTINKKHSISILCHLTSTCQINTLIWTKCHKSLSSITSIIWIVSKIWSCITKLNSWSSSLKCLILNICCISCCSICMRNKICIIVRSTSSSKIISIRTEH